MKSLSFSVPVIVGAVLSFFVHLNLAYQGWKTGNCGEPHSLVIYRYKTDYESGCEGIARAQRFFTDHSLSADIPITLFFRHQLAVDSDSYETRQVLGFFNSRSNYISVPSYRYHPLRKGTSELFGLKIESKSEFEELLNSIITHEVAHLLTHYNYEKHVQRSLGSGLQETMGHGVQEYIAGVVQIGSMDEEMRNEVLAQFDTNLTFTYEEEINQLSYAAEPQQFWIKSYHHFYSKDVHERKLLLERIHSGEFNPDLIFGNTLFALSK